MKTNFWLVAIIVAMLASIGAYNLYETYLMTPKRKSPGRAVSTAQGRRSSGEEGSSRC